jgi:hypothetical protein
LLRDYQHKNQGIENEILAYIRQAKPTETALKIWITETFCLSFREAVQVVEKLQSDGRVQVEWGVVT